MPDGSREFETDEQGGEFAGIQPALLGECFERQGVGRREEVEQSGFVGRQRRGGGLGPERGGILAEVPHQFADDVVGALVLNADNEITASFAKEARSQVTLFSRRKLLDRGVCIRDEMIVNSNRPVMAVSDIHLPGVHNLENYLAAIAAVDGLVSNETIRSFAKSFSGVEHRIELVRELNGVCWYNDSIASSPTRTIAGLRSFPEKVILIAGAYDKNIPYDVLGPEITAHVKALVLTGKTSDKIEAATLSAPSYQPGHPEIYRCGDLHGAVNRAYQIARPGDVVILSPASASFDQFKNFEERGSTFKKYVMELQS